MQPIFQSLPAAKSGDVYYANNADANAINNGGILSLHWFLDRITPTIKKLK
jgi:iron complex transport system substrate-binding protein